MKLDSNICCIAFAFLVACMVCASPVLFLRDRVLGKLLLVAGVVAMTMYHHIAGIIALVAVIALLQNRGIMEGMEVGSIGSSGLANPLLGSTAATTAPAAPSAPATAVQFRQQYCTKGVTMTPDLKIKYDYMLLPTLFNDNKGTPDINQEFLNIAKNMNTASFNTCTPTIVSGTTDGKVYQTIQNMCDPSCNWTMNPAPTPTAMPMPTKEGFTPMSTLRPHIRTGRQIVSNGVDNVKSFAKRLQRQLF